MSSPKPRAARRKTQPRGQARQHSIIEAAIAEFSACGFAGASTRRIADQAGVPQPMIGYYFGSKQGLWLAVVGEAMKAMAAPVAARAAGLSGVDTPTAMMLILRDHLGWLLGHPAYCRLLVQAAAGNEPAYCELADAHLKPHVALITGMIEKAQAEGRFVAGDPHQLYLRLVGGVIGPGLLMWPGVAQGQPDQAISDAVETCLALFFPSPE